MTSTSTSATRDQAGTAAELVSAVAGGDERAFARLYDRLAAAVHGTVRAVVADPGRAEVLTQEVFVELWRTAGSYRRDRDRGTDDGVLVWAMTIARRHAVGEAGRSDPVPTPRERQQARPHLEQELRALSDGERESLLLAHQSGVTYIDIATIREVTADTVLGQLREGLHRLRGRLTAHPDLTRGPRR